MSKTLIHCKIPLDDNGYISVPYEMVRKTVEHMKEMLKENYTIIASPLETTKIDGDSVLINIDCKEYTYNDLMEIIEKAQMYDGLCK